jgi:hydrogenase nickel incorporation protein HypA/HybF
MCSGQTLPERAARHDAHWDDELHELSICQALLAQVADVAMSRSAESVERITIEVGPLAGVDPMLLANAFEIARAGTCASEAVLCIEEVAVAVLCDLCGARSAAAPNRLLCAHCGTYRTRVVAGDELRLRQVELRVAETIPVAAGSPVEE